MLTRSAVRITSLSTAAGVNSPLISRISGLIGLLPRPHLKLIIAMEVVLQVNITNFKLLVVYGRIMYDLSNSLKKRKDLHSEKCKIYSN